MEAYLESPHFERVSTLHQKIIEVLQEDSDIRQFVEDLIQKTSGKFRVIQTFFDSPEHLSRDFPNVFFQPLEEKDIDAMYPMFKDEILATPPGKFFYIFNCNRTLSGGAQALTGGTLV
jgi:F0F1-type ATP synthase delta subunit